MRLKKIKLVGFKTFVDATTLAFPSQLVAIVGPNGCGKSNTIDAIRWVMGESSAKHLRGENLTDVIFNGSDLRKPVGQATVECIFDNSDRTLLGEHAQFSEISVKRTVSREGQSHYYLNNSRCRRRDIVDIILGTGVGPRSYAIIEQGMISRLIEAKPEELRHHLEEVAGISKYKERRRETENRLRHTHENLERLEDLRQALYKQLAHLEHQAQVAQRFLTLKDEQLKWSDELKAIKWRDLDNQHTQALKTQNEHEKALQRQKAALAHQNEQFVRSETEHHRVQDHLQQVQAQYYQQATTVSRLQQRLQHQRERQTQLTSEIAACKQQYQQADEQRNSDNAQLIALNTALDTLMPNVATAESAYQAAKADAIRIEKTLEQEQLAFDDFQRRATDAAKQTASAQTTIEQLEKRIRQDEQRLRRTQTQQKQLDTQALADALNILVDEASVTEQAYEEAKQALAELRQQVQLKKTESREAQKTLSHLQTKHQQARGTKASCEALLKAALGADDQKTQLWLAKQGFETMARLADEIHVTPGYESCVEHALQQAMQAIVLPNLDDLAAHLAQPPKLSVTFVAYTTEMDTDTRCTLPALSQFVTCHAALRNCFQGIYVADSLQDALSERAACRPGEKIMTRCGLCVTTTMLIMPSDQHDYIGVLARKNALADAHKACEAAQEAVASQQAVCDQADSVLSTLDQLIIQQQSHLQELGNTLSRQQADVHAKTQQRQQCEARNKQLTADIEELTTSLSEANNDIITNRELLQTLLDTMANDEAQRLAWVERKSALHQQRAVARQAADEQNQHHLRLHGELKHKQSQLHALREQITRAEQQVQQADMQYQRLTAACIALDAPIKEDSEALHQQLNEQENFEQQLTQAKRQCDEQNSELQQHARAKDEAAQALGHARDTLEKSKLQAETIVTKRNSLLEDDQDFSSKREAILASLPVDADKQSWSDECTKIKQRIGALGAVNLAAIEEFETQSERKHYLDSQYEDLSQAIATLESAIAKIDQETRERFSETFEQVNANLKLLFPRMFGGGEAALALTGDCLLTTGVCIMAQPPGKRNATIHLLSGGEKALTAIALIFAIFKINPAPFCILDEVDAPLDDTNVIRFTKLVAEMATTVQFIFITHNKLTMELAEHLMGVTMREPGVSRIVSVDLKQANELVNA